MDPVKPVRVKDLFPGERKMLLQLFSELSAEDWLKPTVCTGWTVKDIGLHILGDDLGYLSRKRDDFKENNLTGGNNITDWQSLVNKINSINQIWVEANRRISPALLISLLELTGRQIYEFVNSLDPMKIAGAVSWAGPDPAPVWLDIAREYTERWLHQQQIRDAVDKPGLKEISYLHPVIDTFMRALPHTYREVVSPNGTLIKVVISGEAGGEWYLMRSVEKWTLCLEVGMPPSSIVTMDQDVCWRLFTKGVNKESVRSEVMIEGDITIGEKALDTISIIA